MKIRFRLSKLGVLAFLAAFGVGLPGNLLLTTVSAADLDIRQYGARCDGSDDSAAVQAALDALSDGARLTVSCQASIGAAGIRLSRKNDVVIEGVDGGGFVSLAPNRENILFGIEYCDRCAVRLLNIDGRWQPNAGISINYSNNARIEANTIVNISYSAYAAILGLGNNGNLYTWNTVANTNAYTVDGQIVDGTRGIWLGNPKQSLIERNAVITNNKLSDIGASAIAVNGVGATITGNYVERTLGAGVKIAPPVGQGGRSYVRGNTLLKNRFSGVQIENADSSVVVQDNDLQDNQIAGVYVSGGNFVDGEISGNTISGSGEAGIYMYDANGVTIQENSIVGGKGGITFESQTGAIQNVRLYNNVVNNLGGNGLVMLGRGGSIRAVTLDSNSFTDIKLYGMTLEGGSITNPNLIANCFRNVGAGTLLDTRGAGGLQPPPSNQSCTRPPQTRFRPVRINVGGPVYVDTRRQSWIADNDLVVGHPYKVEGTIANTSDPDLYLKGRWNDHTLDFSQAVPNRVYTVTLKFAETYFNGRGQRVFDIYINGDLVLPLFDILSFARPFEAVDRSFKVNVTNGKIDIHMVSHADDPMISAIEIQ